MKKVVCIHLLNDYSGSPLVLSQVVNSLTESGIEVDVITNKSSNGFLNNLPKVSYQYFDYQWSPSKLITLFRLLVSQFILFFKILKYFNKDVVIYINTVLPFGAALAGKLIGKKVLYHIHETSVKPAILKKFLITIVRMTGDKIIYVSEYLRNKEEIKEKKSVTIYNSLSSTFLDDIKLKNTEKREVKNILMLCSLKAYKGVNEFVQLAEMLPEFQFTLVVNSSRTSIDDYFNGKRLPLNLTIHSTQTNVHPFYREADLVLNLSHTDAWIETFGMTILEAMSYEIPVIVPPVGGIAELVIDGFNGYKIDSKDVVAIKKRIQLIFENKGLYQYLSSNAKKKSTDFSSYTFKVSILSAIGTL